VTKRYRISLFVVALFFLSITLSGQQFHKQLSAAEKEHILNSPFTEVTKTEGMPNFSFHFGLAQLARVQISLKIPEPLGAGALFLPSLIVPVVLPKVIDEHDVAVYIFL
jgi:hypothetical protein